MLCNHSFGFAPPAADLDHVSVINPANTGSFTGQRNGMATELVLLTGVTGHVGLRVLVFCLRRGYQVRAVLRSSAQEEQIRNARSIRGSATKHNLTFVQIPDLAKPGALDEALQDVDYIIHAAAPIASARSSSIGVDLTTHFLHPTIDHALNLLRAAQAHPTVKRVVLTSSLAAVIDHVTDTEETVHTASTRATNIAQPPFSSPSEAYIAAKVSALNLSERWMQAERPAFDLVHIAPGHIFGPNELTSDPQEMLQTGSNRMILQPVAIAGKVSATEPGVTVHLDDVAEAHVRALDPSVPGNRLYILSSGGLSGSRLDECFEIVAHYFPDYAGSMLPNNGSLPSSVFKVDASESAQALGMSLVSFEQQVRDVVQYFLECIERRGLQE